MKIDSDGWSIENDCLRTVAYKKRTLKNDLNIKLIYKVF